MALGDPVKAIEYNKVSRESEVGGAGSVCDWQLLRFVRAKVNNCLAVWQSYENARGFLLRFILIS